jgi:hypothetical protein
MYKGSRLPTVCSNNTPTCHVAEKRRKLNEHMDMLNHRMFEEEQQSVERVQNVPFQVCEDIA